MEIHRADPESILVPDERARREVEFEAKKTEEMVKSLMKYGQLQAGVCRLGSDGETILVIGERRLRGCKQCKLPFEFRLKEEIVDKLEAYEIELEENLCRVNLDWKDICLWKDEIHALKQKRFGKRGGAAGNRGWSQRDTAEQLGESLGLVSEDIKLALYIREIPEVASAKTKSEAKKIITRLETTVNRSDYLKDAKERAKTAEPSAVLTSDKAKKIQAESAKTQDAASSSNPLEAKIAEFDKRVWCGTFEDHIQNFKEESFDIVLFDPPWAVGFDQVRLKSGSTKDYDDDIQQNLKNLPIWLELLYEKMATNSHLYMFFGIVNCEIVYNVLNACGFVTNRMPLIWHKQGIHRTRNPKIWPGRSYEPIAYARKGKKDLVIQGASDIIETPAPTPTIKKDHPSAKHPNVYLELLRRSAEPGNKVLDPMCGSGMSLVAADYLAPKLQLDWWGIEKDQSLQELTLFNLAIGYQQIVLAKQPTQEDLDKHEAAERTYDKWKPGSKDLPNDFKELRSRTAEWKAFWKANPDKQDEMLAWRNSQ